MDEIIVVGAGPVGMCLAALCSLQGASCRVFEQRIGSRSGSRAIGITPASLEILAKLGLAAPMLQRGVKVKRACVHNETRVLGTLEFHGISGHYPYVLVVPQIETEELLRGRLDELGVPVHEGVHVESLECEHEPGSVGVRTRAMSGEYSWGSARYVVCADGFRGECARGLGLAGRARYMPYRFIMGDFEDHSGLGNDAHLWFTRWGAIESFPLPAGRRRWIAQLEDGSSEADHTQELERLVALRSSVLLRSSDCDWRSSFRPVMRIARQAAHGRCFLAGDALHAMSPIGGQGMNCGLADAELLSQLLTRLLSGLLSGPLQADKQASHSKAGKLYGRARIRSGRSAAVRAKVGTHIGSLRGRTGSALRSAVVAVLLASPLSRHLASHFAMRTLPYRRAVHALRRK